MTKTIIFDLDGTLADNEHRQHFVRKPQPQWDEFAKGIKDDLPNTSIKELYDVLQNSGRYLCVLVSGRSDAYKAVTQEWLKRYDIKYDALFMRKDGDRRPDHQVKKDILMEMKAKGHEISFVVDDRSATVAMWRENGIVCLQCADHNY